MASAANTKAIGNTPQAKNDTVSASENSGIFSIADLLANDAGGNGKSFHSIYGSATTSKGATLSLDGGSINYDGGASALLQALAAGETATDSFQYAIQMGNGVLSTATVTVQIAGANDEAIFASAPAAGVVTEDSGAGASGSVAFSDVDVSDRHSVGNVTPQVGALGTLSAAVTADTVGGTGGAVGWQYTVDNSAIQYLAEGEKKVSTFTIELSDGHSVVSKNVVVDVVGVNDAAQITSMAGVGGVDRGALIEDAGVVNGKLSAGGVFTFTDADRIDTHSIKSVQLVSGQPGLGTLSANVHADSSNGATGEVRWLYEVDNSHAAVQALNNGQKLTQTYAVTLTDAKTGGDIVQQVTVEVGGKSDATGVDFEDISTSWGWGTVQDGYAGFDWEVTHNYQEYWYGNHYNHVWSHQPEVMDQDHYYYNSYQANVGDGSHFLYVYGYGESYYYDYYYNNWSSTDTMTIGRADGSDFIFDSTHVTALWNNDYSYGETVTLTGYNDGQVVGAQTFNINGYGTPTLLDVSWGAVDQVVMDFSGAGFGVDQFMFG